MKRIGAFLIGVLVGIILIIGGFAVALFTISPSTFGIDLNDEWVNQDNKKLENMAFGDIIAKSVNMLSSEDVTLQKLQDTFGVDLIKELGLDSQTYASLKTKTLAEITGNPKESLAEIKLVDVLNGKIGESLPEVPQSLKTIWQNNDIALGDLFGDNVLSTLLNGVKLSDLVESFKTSTGLTKIIANKDLGEIIEESKKENNDLVKVLLQDVFIGEIIHFSFAEEITDVSTMTEVIVGTVYSTGDDFYRLKANSEEVTYYLAKLDCHEEGHAHTVDCYKPTWKDASNVEPTALMTTLANIELDDLLSGNFSIDKQLQDLKIGDVLDCNFDSVNGWWLDQNGEQMSPLFNNVYSKTLKDFQNGLDVNTLLEGVKVNDVITINNSDPVLLKIIADKDILALAEEIEHVYCGEMQEFELKQIFIGSDYLDLTPGVKYRIVGAETLYVKQHFDGNWYEAEMNCYKSDHEHISDHTDICFEFVWYNYDSSVPGNYVKVTGVDKIIANSTITDLSIDDVVKKIRNLPYTDVINQSSNGAFALIDPTTTINDLPTALTDAINTKSIGELMNVGLIDLPTETKTNFDNVLPGWKDMTVTNFLNAISALLNS